MAGKALLCLAYLAFNVDAANLRSRNSSSSAGVLAHEAACPLPAIARWCTVTAGGRRFQMAAYAMNDIVSNAICSNGRWTDLNVWTLPPPGVALDIGGNIGYFTFLLAKAGWTVMSFEPMEQNVALMRATLCANPDLQSKVTLLDIGLGSQDTTCQFISGNDNFGDGITRCGANASRPVPFGYSTRGSFAVRRLDDVLAERQVQTVDFVKIDVEGYECEVFAGAPNFLATYRPRLIQTEVWGEMQGCVPGDYINSFRDAGYTTALDQSCTHSDSSPPASGQIKDYWMCNSAASFLQSEAMRHVKRQMLFKRA